MDNPALDNPLAYFLPENVADAWAVGKFEGTRFHGHLEGHRGFDGVKP